MTKRPYRKNESAEILDMVFCHPSIRAFIDGFSVGDDYGSQHSTVSVSIPIKQQPPKNSCKLPDFKKVDKQIMETKQEVE